MSASNPEFDSFNSNQMGEIFRWHRDGKMTVEELADHWGVTTDSIQKVIDHKAAKAKAKV